MGLLLDGLEQSGKNYFYQFKKEIRNAAGNTIVFIELNDGSDMKSLQVI